MTFFLNKPEGIRKKSRIRLTQDITQYTLQYRLGSEA